MTLKEYYDLLGSKAPSPGGGSALCQVGAIACSLLEMTLNITAAKLTAEDVNFTYVSNIRDTVLKAKSTFHRLSNDDAAAFQHIADKLKNSRADNEKVSDDELQQSYHEAAQIPLNVIALCCELVRLCKTNLMPLLSKYISCDCTIAANLLKSVAKSSLLNVYANTALIKDTEQAAQLNRRGELLVAEMEKL